ncbi:hypothetical protein B1207_09210 [Legionella quinlivanii]|uniref:Uncharacterized protein n=1 Tax=Legionella quinlivanii TaxID=45073 RepID=A0A364LIV8_9GAMM|nr:hypothetical protein [Legionella quinlivanii]RAP36314.1 hypothetical protein B1207_09210 [Legionella quinlivanii]
MVTRYQTNYAVVFANEVSSLVGALRDNQVFMLPKLQNLVVARRQPGYSLMQLYFAINRRA